jgi:hypothetical protein
MQGVLPLQAVTLFPEQNADNDDDSQGENKVCGNLAPGFRAEGAHPAFDQQHSEETPHRYGKYDNQKPFLIAHWVGESRTKSRYLPLFRQTDSELCTKKDRMGSDRAIN